MTVCIVLSAVFLLVVIPCFIIFGIAEKQFNLLLVRTSKDKWTRTCSDTSDAEQVRMYAEGIEWSEKYLQCMEEVSVENEGLILCGQYYDFGKKKVVIIIAGRTEGCLYSCYFAEPYRKSGFNVLVIDNRSHGFSDGVYNSLGLKEYKDVLAWGKFLHDDRKNEEIVCHGICIGSATAVYALTAKDCPEYFTGMTGEGMYSFFSSSFRQHLLEDKRPVFPFLRFFFFIVRRKTGCDALHFGPEKCMPEMKKDILFLHSREDIYSVSEKAYEMFETCPAEKKKFVYFEHGRHSFVRCNNQEKYDKAIIDFYGR